MLGSIINSQEKKLNKLRVQYMHGKNSLDSCLFDSPLPKSPDAVSLSVQAAAAAGKRAKGKSKEQSKKEDTKTAQYEFGVLTPAHNWQLKSRHLQTFCFKNFLSRELVR
jgi:hypothetical protein